MLEALPPIVHFEEEVSYDDSVKPGTFEVVRDGAVFEVVGSSMQRLIDSVNFDDEESMSWFQPHAAQVGLSLTRCARRAHRKATRFASSTWNLTLWNNRRKQTI